MTSMDDKATTAIREAAAEWVVRIGGAQVSHADNVELAAWLRRSPVHVKEYLRAEAHWAALDDVVQADASDVSALLSKGEGNVVDLSTEPPGTPTRFFPGAHSSTLWRRWRIPAVAAAVLIMVATGTLITLWVQKLDANTYSTGVGEQRRIVLADGSSIELNTRSRLRVAFDAGARDVYLQEGEAFFDVARDPARPFRVLARTAVVRALGTQFNVYDRPSRTVVTVVEGRVAVASTAESSRGAAPVEVGAGSSAQIASQTRPEVSPVRNSAAIAWRQRRLVFEGESLAVVVSEFNRYNTRQLEIADEALAARRISGTFDPNQPGDLVDFLTQHGEVHTQASTDRIVLSTAAAQPLDR